MIYLLATNNPGKAREIRPMFEEAKLTLLTLSDLGLHYEAGEDGDTFLDNATQKAMETAAFVKESVTLPVLTKMVKAICPLDHNGHSQNIAVLSDDSGLVIDALGGEPGVDSALYMGRDTPYALKCQNIISRLANVPEEGRTARFICMLVCVMPDGTRLVAEGTIEGHIAHAMQGDGGFGYDPIFQVQGLGKTMAELTQEEKSLISHRGQAMQKMIELIVEQDD